MMVIETIVPFLLIKLLTDDAGLKMATVRSSVKQTIIQELTNSPKCLPVISNLQIKLDSSLGLCPDRRLTARVVAGIPSAMVSETTSALRYSPPGSFLQRWPFVQTRQLNALPKTPQQMMRTKITPLQISKTSMSQFTNACACLTSVISSD